MLIKALCEYDMLNESNIPDGYCEQPVSFEILLTKEGGISEILDIRKKEELLQKNGKTKTVLRARSMILPVRTQKPGIDKNTIEHRPLYIFGLNLEKGVLTPNDKTDKAKKSHKCFCDWNGEFFKDIDSQIAQAYYKFIVNWKSEEETENDELLKLGKDYASASYCFGLDGHPELLLHDDEKFKQKYSEYMKMLLSEKASDEDEEAECGVLGEKLPVARIHDKIKGIAGGLATGCVLVGMKESAYESYGKKQSFNSNISEKAMKMYTSALNKLLADKSHHQIIDELTIVYFAMKKDDKVECDAMSMLFGDTSATDKERDLSGFFEKTKGGIVGDLSKFGLDSNVVFYVAGLSPNSSRICQKFIMRDKFGDIVKHLVQHQRDLAVSQDSRQIFFSTIKRELISPKSSNEKVPSPLIAGLIEAALKGTNYPEALLSTVVRRIKTDSDEDKNHFIKLNDVRVGVVKGCLNRKARLAEKKEEIKMSLDTENKNPAYLCGRLFAVLEKIQNDASNGGLNKTIKDSFFSSACSKPSSVFPKLVQLSQNHLKKLTNPIFYNKLLGEIIDGFDGQFPSTLSLDEQGMFIIGYYQQNRDLYTKKSTDE